MATRDSPTSGVLSLAGAAFLFSLMALCVKVACARLPGPEVACLRFAIGLCAAGVAALSGRRFRPKNLLALFLRGAFGGGAVILYFIAIEHLSVGVATLLNYSSPLFTILFSALFLGEHLSPRSALAFVLALSGVVLVVRGPGHGLLPRAAAELPYVGLGVLSAVLSGAAVTTIRAMRQHEGSWEIFLAFCVIGGAITAGPTAAHFVVPGGRQALAVLGVGLSSVVAQLLMTHALRYVRANTGGLLLQLTPVSTFALGVLLLGERPRAPELCGAALAVLGVALGAGAQPGAGAGTPRVTFSGGPERRS